MPLGQSKNPPAITPVVFKNPRRDFAKSFIACSLPIIPRCSTERAMQLLPSQLQLPSAWKGKLSDSRLRLRSYGSWLARHNIYRRQNICAKWLANGLSVAADLIEESSDEHVRALRNEASRCSETDSAVASCDDGYFSFQLIHKISPLWSPLGCLPDIKASGQHLLGHFVTASNLDMAGSSRSAP